MKIFLSSEGIACIYYHEMKNIIKISGLVLAAFAAGMMVYTVLSEKQSNSSVRIEKKNGKINTKTPNKKVPSGLIPTPSQIPSVNQGQTESGADGEVSLDFKPILDQIQAAIDSERLADVRAAIAKMREKGLLKAKLAGNSDWTRYVPKELRSKAVEALGDFGGGALTDLLSFLGDSDDEVMQSAINQFEMAVQDFNLSDREKAEVIKMTCQVVDDADFIDSMLSEAQEARNSVAIETLFYIKENGTDTAKSMVQEAIDFFTGDDNITTIEAAQTWLEENPDGQYDDDVHGGVNSDE